MNKIKKFEKFHQIKIKDNWTDGEECVLNLIKLNNKINSILSNFNEEDLKKHPTVGIVIQLTERIYEQIVGGISCVCTKNHASSEILSRTAIESSINILYMLKEDTDSKTFSWLKKYLDDDVHHINDWENSLNSDAEKIVHSSSINTRRELNTAKKEFIDNYIKEVQEFLSVNENYDFPRKILKKFKEVDEEVAYHTVYTRLSATTHLNAEDTISYMMVSICEDEELKIQLGLEHCAYSEFMLLYSLLFYTKIVEKFIIKYNSNADFEVEEIKSSYLSIMDRIGKEWNW